MKGRHVRRPFSEQQYGAVLHTECEDSACVSRKISDIWSVAFKSTQIPSSKFHFISETKLHRVLVDGYIIYDIYIL